MIELTHSNFIPARLENNNLIINEIELTDSNVEYRLELNHLNFLMLDLKCYPVW